MSSFARFAVLLTLAIAVLPLIAALSLCSSMPCCAKAETRVAPPMTCCAPPTVSADSPAAEKAFTRIAETAKPQLAEITVKTAVTTARVDRHTVTEAAPPAESRVRLAHLATLLI